LAHVLKPFKISTLHGLTTTTRVVVVEIRPSARKHGVSDDDIRHAIDNAIVAITRPEQPEFTMLIGASISARLLEIGVVETDDQDYVIYDEDNEAPTRTRRRRGPRLGGGVRCRFRPRRDRGRRAG